MERILIGTAAGGLTLYLAYLLTTGQSPKVTQRGTSTVPAAVNDSRFKSTPSGSASSIVTAVANSGLDPTLEDRPAELGGDAASTGHEQTESTSATIDQKPVEPDDPCKKFYVTRERHPKNKYFDGLKMMRQTEEQASYNKPGFDFKPEMYTARGYSTEMGNFFAEKHCVIDYGGGR